MPDELSVIEASPALLASAPGSYLDAMLAEWQQWAPGDVRGTIVMPLCMPSRTAVNEVGLGLTAQEL